MATVRFLKGMRANLPSTYAEGSMYACVDEHALYLDVSATERIRFGDFQEFATLTALQANTNPSTTALYYVTDLNVLAKWDGAKYVQINLDTGATSVGTTGTGNALDGVSYDPATRKLTFTKTKTFATTDDVDTKIAAKVGALGQDSNGTDYDVKGYVDAKVADVVAGSIDGLGTLASKDEVTEAELGTALATKLNGKADVGTTADASTVDSIKGAKKYADEKAAAAQTAAESYADTAIAGLDVADTAVAAQLVSAVSETDGKITVTRRALVAADIPAIAQSKVTGLTDALAGKQDALTFNTAYNASTNKAATMTDVTNAVAGLAGAMHYVGESTTDPATSVTVTGVTTFAKGDVVTYSAKEFVYDGAAWRELGDESSFAVKGSIKDSDVAADAAIAQSKIAGLTDALAGKAAPADITTAIGALDVADTAVAGQLVSAVAETDGKISVTRRALVAADIPTLAISKVSGLQTALDSKLESDDVDTKVSDAIAALDKADTAVANQFVTAVSETDGVITVTRAQPAVANISGLSTALSAKQDTLVFNTAYNATSNKVATMSDVSSAIEWGSF